MTKLLLNLLIRWYVNRYDGITKMTSEEELKRYQFKTAEDVREVLKNNITIQTLRHFEASNEQERWMVKGAALALKLIKDRHDKAVEIMENVQKDEKKKLSEWISFKGLIK